MSKVISLLGVLAVTAVNTVLLFFFSLLAATGEGNPSGIYVVLAFGGTFILVFTGIALFRWARALPSVGVAAMALPAAWGAGILIVMGAQILGYRIG